ncbi:MAG: hypothetical protein QME66_12705 [Candidatus Eisenbacteria bacterium]|nr:hypothetical protein [Candidatus Eisenbacteria bacterium]
MPALSQQMIEELRGILKEDYGQEVNSIEVFEIATTLVGYFDLLARIDRQEETREP